MKLNVEEWNEVRFDIGFLILGTAVIMLMMGLISERVSGWWFPMAAVLMFSAFFCWVLDEYTIKKAKYWILFICYLRVCYGDRIRLSQKIERWFRDELRGYPEDQRIDAAELIFPQVLLVWYGGHRYLLRERKIIDKEILQDFLRQIRSIREKKSVIDSVIDYGLNSIIKEMELSGELPGESKGTRAFGL